MSDQTTKTKPLNDKMPLVCIYCHKQETLMIDIRDFLRWKNDCVLIQNAFPYLDAGQRQFLKMGTCPECFDKMFAPLEGEEDFDE